MDGECINCGEVGNWCRCDENYKLERANVEKEFRLQGVTTGYLRGSVVYRNEKAAIDVMKAHNDSKLVKDGQDEMFRVVQVEVEIVSVISE